MPRLPKLRLHKRMQLMPTDTDVLTRMDGPVEQAYVTYVPGFDEDKPRPTALSLAETVEMLVRGGRTGPNLYRRQQKSTMR